MGVGEFLITSLIWVCDVTTVGLCVICKIPQIWAIYKSRSVEGLSAHSLLLEVLTYAISLAYNAMKGYPLSSYMEDPFLVTQTLIVLLIVYYYQSELDVQKFGMIGGGVAIFYALSLGFPHPLVLTWLLASTLPMKVVSKMLQIIQIWKSKSAGNISLVSWAINIYTCVTRIITTAIVTGDQTLLLKHTMSVTLNAVVIASALHFRPKSDVIEEGEANGQIKEDKIKNVPAGKNKSD